MRQFLWILLSLRGDLCGSDEDSRSRMRILLRTLLNVFHSFALRNRFHNSSTLSTSFAQFAAPAWSICALF